MPEDDSDDLLKSLELHAMERAAEEGEGDEEAPRLADALAEEGTAVSDAAASAARDITLAGYIEVHDRVPAFEGADGQPYTVDVGVEEEAPGEYVAFLIFLRWAATGAGIMDHLESGDVAEGATEEEARTAALELSLYEVKAELDAAIERRRTEAEE